MGGGPFSLVHAGYLYSGTIEDNNAGNVWSATARSIATHAYHLGFAATGVGPQENYGLKYMGFSVRCVAI